MVYRVVYINKSARVREWMAGILRSSTLSAFLGWVAEHFEDDSRNLAGMFLSNPVVFLAIWAFTNSLVKKNITNNQKMYLRDKNFKKPQVSEN